jgi:hypothetical protein
MARANMADFTTFAHSAFFDQNCEAFAAQRNARRRAADAP